MTTQASRHPARRLLASGVVTFARRVGRTLVACVLLAILAGCGGHPDPAEGTGHDAADVTFATAMVSHHTQAIAMAKLAASQAASPAVKELATQITAEQIPEIAQLQWMLADWGQPAAPTATMPDMPGMTSMPGMAARGPGMLTDQQMAQLRADSGPVFDHAFLQLMIAHHEGGITMARSELADGSDPDAMLMAQNISDAQQAAVTLMQQLLAT